MGYFIVEGVPNKVEGARGSLLLKRLLIATRNVEEMLRSNISGGMARVNGRTEERGSRVVPRCSGAAPRIAGTAC